MKKKIVFICSAVLAVIVFSVAIVLYKTLSPKISEKINNTSSNTVTNETTSFEVASDFTVFDAKGNTIKLSDFKGKGIVVNFWADWCSPCRQELPDFMQEYEKHKNDVTFMMVNVSCQSDEQMQSILKFAEDNSYSFPIYFDKLQSASIAYGVRTIPLSVFIDKNGNIIGTHNGVISKQTLENYIQKIQ